MKLRNLLIILALVYSCQSYLPENTIDDGDKIALSGKPGNFTLISNSNNSLYLSWNKIENADSYEVMFSEQQNFSSGNKRWIIKRNELVLNEGNTYNGYFRVRALTSRQIGIWSLSIKSENAGRNIDNLMEAYLLGRNSNFNS